VERETAELTLVDASGKPGHYEVEIASFPSTGAPVGKAALTRAVCEETKQEPQPASSQGDPPGPTADELRIILDTATDGIVTLDIAGRIVSFSAGAEAIFGYRQSEVHGRPIADLMDPESRKTVRDYLAALGEGGIASVFNDGREVHAMAAKGG